MHDPRRSMQKMGFRVRGEREAAKAQPQGGVLLCSHLFASSFIHLFICPFIQFIHLFFYSFSILSFICSFVTQSTHSFIHSFNSFFSIYSFSTCHSFTHLFICSFLHSFVLWFLHSLVGVFVSGLIHNFLQLYDHSGPCLWLPHCSPNSGACREPGWGHSSTQRGCHRRIQEPREVSLQGFKEWRRAPGSRKGLGRSSHVKLQLEKTGDHGHVKVLGQGNQLETRWVTGFLGRPGAAPNEGSQAHTGDPSSPCVEWEGGSQQTEVAALWEWEI